jgi:surfeit locus 1 family protein
LKSLAVLPDFIYRKVLTRGKWDHEHEILLGPRVRDGTHGYHLITPLVRTDATTILVDRGFISPDFADKTKRIEEPDVDVEVKGMLRSSQARNSFTPENHPEKGEWFWVDIDAMAEFAGGEQAGVQPVLVEEIFGV